MLSNLSEELKREKEELLNALKKEIEKLQGRTFESISLITSTIAIILTFMSAVFSTRETTGNPLSLLAVFSIQAFVIMVIVVASIFMCKKLC